MNASLSATGQLASEVFALLRETDPARWTDDVAQRARERWQRICQAIESLMLSLEQVRPALREAVAQLAALIKKQPGETGAQPAKSYWMALRAELMPAYERLAAQLRADALPAPTLRPTNWNRIGFHVASGLGALLLLELVLSERGTLWATGLFAGTFWFLEITRALSRRWNDRLMQVRFFQLIIHPHEVHRVNSATWYATALLALAIFSPPLASAVGLAVLALGDPVAGLVGRRWGRHPLIGGRTLEGSLAFVLAGALAAFVTLGIWHPIGVANAIAVALLASLAGAAAEMTSRRVDDNLSVPLAAALGAGLIALALGVPL